MILYGHRMPVLNHFTEEERKCSLLDTYWKDLISAGCDNAADCSNPVETAQFSDRKKIQISRNETAMHYKRIILTGIALWV